MRVWPRRLVTSSLVTTGVKVRRPGLRGGGWPQRGQSEGGQVIGVTPWKEEEWEEEDEGVELHEYRAGRGRRRPEGSYEVNSC